MTDILAFFNIVALVPLWKALLLWAVGTLFGFCVGRCR